MRKWLWLAALLALLLCGCVYDSDDFNVTETVTPEQIRAMLSAAEESLREAETTTVPVDSAEPEIAAESDTEVVYWSPSGGVWHLDPACVSLKQAKSVLSGSVTDAMAAGKARACKTCET